MRSRRSSTPSEALPGTSPVPENGEKTVKPPIADPSPNRPTAADLMDRLRQKLARWKPPHNCHVLFVTHERNTALAGQLEIHMAWLKPRMKGLRRAEFFHVYVTYDLAADDAALFEYLNKVVNGFVDYFVEEDTKRLLACGPRTQTADQDRPLELPEVRYHNCNARPPRRRPVTELNRGGNLLCPI